MTSRTSVVSVAKGIPPRAGLHDISSSGRPVSGKKDTAPAGASNESAQRHRRSVIVVASSTSTISCFSVNSRSVRTHMSIDKRCRGIADMATRVTGTAELPGAGSRAIRAHAPDATNAVA